MQEMHDIVEISEQPQLLLWWQWALVVLGALLVLAVLVTLMRRTGKVSNKHKALSPLEYAQQQLSQLDPQTAPSSNQLAVQLSVIVRHYLQRKFGDNSLFLTDEEFHARSSELSKLPEASSNLLSDYLTKVSEHKYAPNANHPAALENMIQRASEVLQNLDSNANTPTTS